MTVSENLAVLESLHQDVSAAIIRLRELLQYQSDFTEAKKASLEAEVKALLGTGQIQMDELPDYRQFGQGQG